MNDKERLEKVKTNFGNTIIKSGRSTGKIQLGRDVQWLIKQAELYSKAHDTIIGLGKKIDSLQTRLNAKIMFVGNGNEDDMYALQEENIELNKRVRELEKDIKNYKNVCDSWKVINDYDRRQNKHYREAIEKILEEAYEEAGLNPDTDMQLETYISKTARKALEGE